MKLIMFSTPLQGASNFSTSAVARQRPDHRMYKLVDWDQVTSGKYAVIDPLDASAILYLSLKEYLAAQKVWLSNDIATVVLATPQDQRPSGTDTDPKPKASPRRSVAPGEEVFGTKGAKARIWSCLVSPLKRFINKYAASKSQRTDHDDVSEKVLQPVVEVNEGNLVDLILEWGSLLHFRLFGLASGRGFLRALEVFSAHVLTMYKSQGGLMLTKRMKIYAIVIKSYLGGNPLKSTEALGVRVRLRKGLPACLPREVRSALRSKSTVAFRAWISVMHSYKAMVVKSPGPDLSSIVTTHPELKGPGVDGFRDFASKEFPKLFKEVGSKPDFENWDMHISFRSGPNGSAIEAIPKDTLAWVLDIAHRTGFIAELTTFKTKDLRSVVDRVYRLIWDVLNGDKSKRDMLKTCPLFAYAYSWKCSAQLLKLFEAQIVDLKKGLGLEKRPPAPGADVMAKYAHLKEKSPALYASLLKKLSGTVIPLAEPARPALYQWEKRLLTVRRNDMPPWAHLPSDAASWPSLSKLAFLEEPAGKVRTIAIVDWYTQQFLKPIHSWMFSLLRTLPSDATFDQEGAVKRFAKTVEQDVTSFDLKSATEMIPQDLYLAVLSGFFGSDKARSWLALLVDRWFHYQIDKVWKEPIRYRRGQPMGALSSWASMALVHHCILQYAAKCAGRYPFWDYTILGDDIVIASESVANLYQAVCSDLKIPLSLPKSLRSKNGTFDFASQILQGTKNFSPLSLREELAACEPGRRIECTLRSARRGLIDMNARNWFSSFLRYTIPPTAYKQVVDERNNGRLDPVAKAVQIHFLGSLTSPFVRIGLLGEAQVSVLESFRAAMPRLDLFTREFKTIFSLGKNPHLKTAVLDMAFEVLAYKAKYVTARYKNLKVGFESWTRAVEDKGFLASASSLLDSGHGYLAPILSDFGVIERKFNDYQDWVKYQRPMLKNIEIAARNRTALNPQQLEALTVSFWPVVEEADIRLMTSPETVLGVAPPEPDVDIYSRTPYRLVAQAEQRFHRLGVWSELATLRFQQGDLGLLGFDSPEWLINHFDAIKTREAISSGKSRSG